MIDIDINEQLGEYLIDAGKLGGADLARAHQLMQDGGTLASTLATLGLVSEESLAEAISELSGCPRISAAQFPDEPLLEDRLPLPFLSQHQILPVRRDADGLLIASSDPGDEFARRAIEFATGDTVSFAVARMSEISQALERIYAEERGIEVLDAESPSDDDIRQLRDLASEAPVVKYVNQVLGQAVESGASDLHLEPFEGRMKVRLRIDGQLADCDPPPASLAAAVISRVKILSSLDIAERRLPQDGRANLSVRGRRLDARVSTAPTIHGESLVLRLLYRDVDLDNFPELGFDPAHIETIDSALARPHGIVLVTGPTGSGKSTTLYAALRQLNQPQRKIITVEDPVEYQLEGVNQMQVKPEIGLSFANALRAIVRQDPDVIMIGEMRDSETARIAVQSALTGHLVLSTLHTNTAASSITRLLDLGVEPFLLTASVQLIVAQRLLRLLCPNCITEYRAPESIRDELQRLTNDDRLYRAEGCEQCHGSGYSGRTTVAEVLPVDETIRDAVLAGGDASALEKLARQRGMRSMYEDGLIKAGAGLTSLEEVLRVTREI